MIKTTIKAFICILLSLTLVSCGSNIFEGFENKDAANDLTTKIENASTTADYVEIISDTEKIIASADSSNSEKQNAYFIKAEATLGKAELSTLDLFADIASAATDEDAGALNLIDIEGKYDDLLAASQAIENAESVDSTSNVNEDQNLLKGVVNTLLVVDSIKKVFEVTSAGDLSQKDTTETYWDSLVGMVKPAGESSPIVLSDYSSNADEGFKDSASLTSDQQKAITDTNTNIKESEALYTVVKAGGTYNGVSYAGVSGDDQPTSAELLTIESQLDTIFAED
ncbi:hypothetical protein DID80_05270 [Candidatus Marinamargulisbacteria bacterium SCGC AAA071-K20]|nr:hypothetical protein DID80_05270 [Candidatus Marinamargulisbacteria bacterium SCGC AAA071-K20]